MPSDETQFALIVQRLDTIDGTLKSFIGHADVSFVTQDQFEPVRKIVYGIAGTVGLAFVAAVAALVIKR